MKMDMRRTAAMAAALAMCLSLAACGQADTDKEANNDAPAVQGAAPETNDMDAAPEEAAGETGEAEAITDDYAYDLAGDEAFAAKGELTGELAMTDGAFEAGEGMGAGPEEDGYTEEPVPGDTDIITNAGEAFVLTAGEWNDNDNWGFFMNLVKNQTISFPAFGLDPTNRIAVTVTKDGSPAKGQPVQLLDRDGNVIWSAVSDKNGMAYVFYKQDQTPAQVVSGEASQTVTAADSSDEQGKTGTTEAALEVSTSTDAQDTQVMFILDTTGSMYDEIAYLQMDFSSIAEEVDDGHTSFSVNFYRDQGDDYVTKCNDFSTDVKGIQKLINQESADGGGDFPEAVAEILEETITENGQWSESANKIAFLIFDAPPHEGKEQQLEAAVKTAAEKGIHLVPVVSSGADRETELFGRAMAAQTGSNYIFLTDDSGVGGSHLEPIIGDYEVELLHDVIVRNITELRG